MSTAIRRADTAFAGAPTKDRPQKEPKFLAFLREQPCIVSGCHTGDVIAHHVRLRRTPTGHLHGHNQAGKRPPDSQCVPLSDYLHQQAPDALHRGNEADWWRERGIDPLVVAELYYELWESGVRGTLTPEQTNTIERLARRTDTNARQDSGAQRGV